MAMDDLLIGGGIIDSNYTGTIIVIVHNIGSVERRVKAGTAIAQLLLRSEHIPDMIIVPGLVVIIKINNFFKK